MRCPSCGTENEPDSRFCGGCGARLAGALPPTQKIDTGAQPIQSPPSVQPSAQYVRAPTSQPPRVSGPQNVPPASYPMAPSVNRPPSVDRPPAQGSNGAQPVPAQSMDPTSQRRKPSLSEAPPSPPKRNMALIAIVLVIDLALAGAGAYMLAEGLREPEAAPAPPAKASVVAPPSTPAAPAAVVSPIVVDAAVAVTVDAAPPPSDVAVAAPTAGSGSAEPKKTIKSRKKKSRTNNEKPVDPYDDGPPLGIPPANPDPS